MTGRTTQETAVEHRRGPALPAAVMALVVGAAVAVALGVFGRQHQPSAQEITLGFASLTAMKVWLATAAGVLALGQLVSALWMYGKLGRPAPRGLGLIHRFSGATAVVLSLPVAYSCLWSLGFQTFDTRVMVHSVFGCLFYGAFVTKVIALHTKSSPGWLLPLAGGTLVSALVIVVLASSVWFFATFGVPTGAGGY